MFIEFFIHKISTTNTIVANAIPNTNKPNAKYNSLIVISDIEFSKVDFFIEFSKIPAYQNRFNMRSLLSR